MMVNLAEVVRKIMGWCPVANTRISKLASGEDYANMPEGGDASLRVLKSMASAPQRFHTSFCPIITQTTLP